MSDKIVEQADFSASKIGKFNTAEDLLAAYNALESEFTKRCQLIKQLQAELNALYAQANGNADCNADGATSVRQQKEQSEIAPTPPEMQAQPVPEAEVGACAAVTFDAVLNEILQNACDYAEALSRVPEIMSACIASYKQRLIKPQPQAAPAGMAVIVPAKKPRTLLDAKRLADELLAKN